MKTQKPALPKNALKVALYARVSTTDQNCRMQLTQLREYCARREWRIVKEYVDNGFSGSSKSRPALDRLMQDAQEHRFQAVIVWKLDRWGRGVLHCCDTIQQLKQWQIRWMSFTENLDTDATNPASELLMFIMMAFAQFERSMIRERVQAGVDQARRMGKHCGRPKRIFRRDEAIELRQAGMTICKIAEALNISPMTTWRYLGGQKRGKRGKMAPSKGVLPKVPQRRSA